MFSDFSVFYFLIYAAGIGFAAAIIYTNIQRTALSVFINYLISNSCFDESSAVSLDAVCLTNIQKNVVKSAIKNQHGFKRIIGCVKEDASKSSDEETFFENHDYNKYFLSTDNVEEIKKKYTFKTMSARLVVLFVAALAAVIIATSFLVSWLIETVSTPKLEEGNDIKAEDELNKNEQTGENDTVVDEMPEDEDAEQDIFEDETGGPRIPM